MPLAVPDRLRVSECAFNPWSPALSGGPSMTGFAQTMVNPYGRWAAKMTLQVAGEEEILCYEAFLAGLRGRAVECLVALRNGIRPRDANGVVMPWRTAVAWSSGALWMHGAGWAAAPRADARIFAAAQGATAATIRLLNCTGLRPGNHFGLADRLHRILTAVPSASQAASVDVTFWPPLRAAAVNGGIVQLAAPVCRMKLAKDDSGQLSLRWREQSTPTLEFVESFT